MSTKMSKFDLSEIGFFNRSNRIRLKSAESKTDQDWTRSTGLKTTTSS